MFAQLTWVHTTASKTAHKSFRLCVLEISSADLSVLFASGACLSKVEGRLTALGVLSALAVDFRS